MECALFQELIVYPDPADRESRRERKFASKSICKRSTEDSTTKSKICVILNFSSCLKLDINPNRWILNKSLMPFLKCHSTDQSSHLPKNRWRAKLNSPLCLSKSVSWNCNFTVSYDCNAHCSDIPTHFINWAFLQWGSLTRNTCSRGLLQQFVPGHFNFDPVNTGFKRYGITPCRT